MNDRIKRFLFRVAFMVMCSSLLPVLFVNLPPFVRTHHLWTSLWFVSLIFLNPNIFRNKVFGIVFLYGILICLVLFPIVYSALEFDDLYPVVNEFYGIITAVSILTHFVSQGDYYHLEKLVKSSLVFVFITSILSIVTTIINPMYARDLIGKSELIGEELSVVLSYRKFGGGQYDFFSGIVCLFPALFYVFHSKRNYLISRKQSLLLIVTMFVCLIRVQIFANIMIAFVAVLTCIFMSKNRYRNLILIGFFLFIIVIIPKEIYIHALEILSTNFDTNSETYYKLTDMANYLKFGEDETSGTGYRAERFPLLLQSFLSNPLIGGEYKNHHMYWMNKLATFGLLGTLPFVFMLYLFFKNITIKFDPDMKFYYYFSVITIIGLGFMKALVGRNLWYMYCFILPGMFYVILTKISYDKKNN